MLILLARFVLALVFIPVAGYPLALWLTGPRLVWSTAARWALAWSCGLGLVSLEMLAISFLGWQFNLATIVVPVALLGLLTWAAYGLRSKNLGTPAAAAPHEPLSWWDKGLVATLAFQVFFNAVLALYIPLDTTDAWDDWGLKAKAFFIEGALSFRHIAGLHRYYPLLVPLNMTWVYVGLGQVNDGWAKAIFTLSLLALTVLFYQLIRGLGFQRTAALLATVFLTTAGGMLVRHGAVAQADVPSGLFYGLACLSLLSWMRQPTELSYLAIAGLGAGGAIWTKYEGLPHVLILTAVAGLFMALSWRRQQFPPKLQMLAAYGLPIAAGLLPWMVFRQLNGIAVDGEHLGAMELTRLPLVLKTMGLAMLDIQRWGILWPTLAVVLIVNWRRLLQPSLFYPTLLLGLNLLFYLVAYLVTSHINLAAQINDTIHRLLLHILPLTVLVIAYGIGLWIIDQASLPSISEVFTPSSVSMENPVV